MAFATYADLQTQVANWLTRSDLTANIPDFITLFEAEAATKLKVRQQQTTTTLTPSGGSVALPTDYLAWVRLTYTGTPRHDLDYVGPSYLQSHYDPADPSPPSGFTIEGSTIKVGPMLDTTALEFVYNQKTPALSVTLNWLYTSYPNLYLAGTLTEAFLFVRDPDNAALWKTRRDAQFDEIKMVDFRAPGNLTIRIPGINP